MRVYATAPGRLARQVTGDLLLLAWVVGWILVGRWVHALVSRLAAPAEPLRDAGTSLRQRMEQAASDVSDLPLVGDRLDPTFAGAAGVGTDLVKAGESLERSVSTVAWVLSLLTAGTPILMALIIWGVARWAWMRRAAALGREVNDPESQELLALRALVRQDPRRLQRLYPDPVAAYRGGDPEVLRRLADLELAELGLRSRRRPSRTT